MVSSLVRVAFVASAVLAASCSLVVDPDQVQCNVAEDCAAIDEPDRRCIDNLCTGSFKTDCREIPWATEVGEESLDISFRAVRKNTTPFPGIALSPCPNDACSPTTPSAETAATGLTDVRLHQGFRRRVEIPTPDSELRASYILHMHPYPDAAKPETLEVTAVVIPLSEITSIADQLPVQEHKADQAHLFFGVRDCQGEVLQNVTVFLQNPPDNLQVVYLGTNLNPDLSLSETGTGAQGGGVMYNIPPGLKTIYAYHNNIKIFQQTLVFRAETITTTQIVPSMY